MKTLDVTLVAMGSTSIAGNIEALIYSRRRAHNAGLKFKKVKFITHVDPLFIPQYIEVVKCPRITSIDQWNYEIIYNLGDYIDTRHALLIHPDGYLVHPENWNDEWLRYDYIGAPWPLPTDDYSYRDMKGNIVRVGNSVSLRSKKIMTLPKQLGLEWKSYFGNTNEDGFLCCHNRLVLEENGCKFAPLEVAKWFSRETELPENEEVDKPFVFHKHAGRNSQYRDFE